MGKDKIIMENRIYKFRAWDNHLDVMYPDIHTLDSLNEYLSKDKYSVMQFTGLKDKNGVEIYEGYIVERFGTNSKFIVQQGKYKLKPFMNGDIQGYHHGYYLKPIPHKGEHGVIWNTNIQPMSDDGYLIIGNIYENPELLK